MRCALLNSRTALASLALGAVLAQASFQCFSDVALSEAVTSPKKGICLDDSTLQGCPEKVPDLWPNTETPIGSLRLFKVWDANWDASARFFAWRQLRSFVERQQAKVLLGSPVTCDQEADDQDWTWVKEFIQTLGSEYVMGVAIGNELDILYAKRDMSPSCIQEMWNGGRYWRNFQARVADLSAMGLSEVPVTAVLTGASFSGAPFMETDQARVNSFLVNASTLYGTRFVFTFNLYPYFNPSYGMDPGSSNKCSGSLNNAACFGGSCFVPSSVGMARRRMRDLGAVAGSSLLWVGETGWSSRVSQTLDTNMLRCTKWSSDEIFQDVYANFLEWDLNVAGDETPDHAFYFTMRDSSNFGHAEHFGLIGKCWEPECKISTAGYKAPTWAQRGEALDALSWVWFVMGVVFVTFSIVLVCANRLCRRQARDDVPMVP